MLKAVKKALDKAMSVSSPEEVLGLINEGALVLDVRNPEETKAGIARGARNIPLAELQNHLQELPRDRTIVTYCNRGGRAAKAQTSPRSPWLQGGQRWGLRGDTKDSRKQTVRLVAWRAL